MRKVASVLILAWTSHGLRSNPFEEGGRSWKWAEVNGPRSAAYPTDRAVIRPSTALAMLLRSRALPTAFNPPSPRAPSLRSVSSFNSLRPMDRGGRIGHGIQEVVMSEAVAASPLETLQKSMADFLGQIGGVSAESVLRSVFDGVTDPEAIAAACSEDVVWEDMSLPSAAVGRDAVRDLLISKFPEGVTLRIDRISDGGRSGGFTWYREVDGQIGLRGTLFAELDESGQITYVREGCEPLFKPGEATEQLLKAVTANIDKPDREPTYTPAEPRTASEIVKYLWQEAYPNGATPAEALKLFADDIIYEDFNYPVPFVGKPAVTEFVNAFDIPGIEFIPLKISEGKRGVAFTWIVKVNGQDGPSGISFYEVNQDGKVSYIRDIPAPSVPFGLPPPFASLAAILQPKLRVFEPREKLW